MFALFVLSVLISKLDKMDEVKHNFSLIKYP
nr:MAG TPA: hypothetical protein [Caudoviricetes sp.]DAS84292.1 MAG TPA: hypothetical protein [Caudoviricetes sp.]DAV10782.1 MAG TPA: hypothetical protein [Caudoviricetes sp.]